MSTRAFIRIIDPGFGKIDLYHHSDGYPDGIGVDLKSVLNHICKDPEYGCRDLIQDKLGLHDATYAPALCLPGDVEYVYVIDCKDKTIKCFRHNWNESFEDCFKAEREVRIPEISET